MTFNHAVVTGSTGFVGRWLVRELLKSGKTVTAVVRPKSRNLSYLSNNPNLNIVECAMQDYSMLGNMLSVPNGSIFYHLAWNGVSGQDRANLSIQTQNIEATVFAVKAAAKLGCSAFINLGTIMEQESAAAVNLDGARPAASYIYGEAKHFAHLASKAIAAESGIAHICPILTNAYGEYEYSQRFIISTLQKILKNEPLEFTSGTQIYDFVHVEDVAKALIAIGEKGKAFHNYVIGSGKARPLREFIETIARELAPNAELNFGNVLYTGAQLPKECYSIDSLLNDTGYMPMIPFETGIHRVMDWLRKEN